MKLVKALSGDMVNIENADSLNIAPSINSSDFVVYARLGNTSHPLFRGSEQAATEFLDELKDELEGTRTSWTLDIDPKLIDLITAQELLAEGAAVWTVTLSPLRIPTVTETMVAKAEERRAEQEKEATKKRAPRKKVNPDE